ncbi:glutathione-disulfide reductase [Vreelandella lutescens]|uniref:Glutathione reductase n=1 Tax=Vreelandella lutescens TaxID=1602943 RepID=A0ABQ1NTM0_9GAMM|nr:glutathione-disulfide reductase [Halomonas lutescens]GGC84536.1 glutathione reductase [Halomonas lutescens]
MSSDAEYDVDLFVIGAGSGGVRAARMAAAAGARVAIAEDRYLGGTCVNVGCVPKKLYSYAAHFHDSFDDAAGFGWHLDSPATFDWPTLRDNKTSEIKRLNGIYQRMLEGAGVTLFNARARVANAHTVTLTTADGEVNVSAEKILLATGGWPWVPEFPGSDLALNSNQVFDLDTFPKRFLVLGGGYIAVEFASIFNGLGSETHLIYRGDLLLKGFDQEVREFTRDEMAKKGVNLHFSTNIARIEQLPEGSLKVELTTGEILEVDAVLSATGRKANITGLGIESLGIALNDEGKLSVNERYETQVPSILALGDLTAGPELTPVALAEAMQLVDIHFHKKAPRPLDYATIPTAVFCHPNIGTVGLSEEAARDEFPKIRVYRTDFRAMKHTLSGSQERMLMKLIVDDASDVVVGAHMVGEEAGELIQGIAIAVRAGLTKEDFDRTIGIHPTGAEEFVTMRTPSRY